jgi:hypothetical protein
LQLYLAEERLEVSAAFSSVNPKLLCLTNKKYFGGPLVFLKTFYKNISYLSEGEKLKSRHF